MRFRFSDCELDPARFRLRRQGERVPVEPKVFAFLLLLVRASGRLVSKAAMREHVWGGVTVTEASVRRLVKEARRAVGDDGRSQRVIETVHASGYLLVTPVRQVRDRD